MRKNYALPALMVALFSGVLMLCQPAFAAGVGGLDKGTSFIGDLRLWAYGFVGGVALLHILWKVFQAYTEMDSWSGVLKSLMYAAIAGGCVIAAEACYQIFK